MLRSESEQTRWVWLIVLIGLALRLFGLASESLWLDEVITAERVYENLGQILVGWDSETQGPLYYVWIKCWGLMFGTDEWTLRIWSVVWGTLTIWYTYLLGRQLFTRTGALLAALFMAVHPFAIHYSQEARPYALFLLLTVASYHYLLKLMRQHSWSGASIYILTTAGAFYTHAFGIFLIVSHVCMFWLSRHESRFHGAKRYPKPYVQTLLVLLLVCAPELFQNALAALDKIEGTSPAGWIPVPGIRTLFKVPAEYFMNMTIGFIVLPLVSIFALFRVATEPQLRMGFQWLVIVGACFWLLPWLVSLVVTPIYVGRYTISGLLVVIYLMSSASASLQALPRTLFVIFILGLTAYPLLDYYTKVDKDPWRQSIEYLSERVKPNDVIVAYPHFVRGAVLHYLPSNLRAQFLRINSEDEFEQSLADPERVWEITSYDAHESRDITQLAQLDSWGKVLRRVNIDEDLKMNPHRFWSANITITLREQLPDLQGPPPLLTPDS